MTNFIAGSLLPHEYLLGVLNSRLLNWRIKLTSTNNYLSAAEVESLPVPRVRAVDAFSRDHVLGTKGRCRSLGHA